MGEDLIDSVAAWARSRPDLHAAILVGSHARSDAPADEWSDIDIALVADDPSRYTEHADWVRELGEPLATFVESTPVGLDLERRILFASGEDVDLAFMSREQAEVMRETGLPPGPALVVRRGYRILFDEIGLTEAFEQAAAAVPARQPPPDEEAFAEVVNEFWYMALWAARKLARGELWVARSISECCLKALLALVLAWHAQARDEEVDTWHRSRFLERWTDPVALRELAETAATYDLRAAHAALLATTRLFERVGGETARELGFAYPVVDHDRVRAWIKEL